MNPMHTHGKAPELTYRRIAPAIFLVSLAVIGWQLALMRCLLTARYHHFSFLIISCALLGFGIGGTVLSLWRGRCIEYRDDIFRWGILCFGMSLPISLRVGETLPVEVYFSPLTVISTVAWWFAFWFVHVVPFSLAGLLIGLALMTDREEVHKVYAANLAGSAAGALAGIVLLGLFPANGLAVPLSLCVILSGLFLIPGRGTRLFAPYPVAVLAGGGVLVLAGLLGADTVFPLKIDQYKTLAYVQNLERQGAAHRERTLHGLRGRIDLYSGPHFHTLLSLSAAESPPPMDLLMRDGFPAGSVLSIRTAEEAEFLSATLAALPYRLIEPKSVLILGETGGTYVWLARLSKAESIVVVQPDRNIIKVLEEHDSRVLADPRVRVVTAEPRAFLDSSREKFDIIHLSALEGFAPGSGGIGGLREDYLATVEGFHKCLDSLTPHGLAGVVRGIQDPARDNIKIAATWIHAFEGSGVRRPARHILMARDELSVATLVSRSPVSTTVIQEFRRVCRDSSWDPEWFPGIQPEETNRRHVLPGPEDSSASWYHHALTRLLSEDRETFYGNWIADVRPATDDSPFFHDFFRLQSVGKLRDVFGPLWPARSEMGFLVLIVAAVATALAATVLLPGPVILLRRAHDPPSGMTIALAVVYFAGLGTGFMLLEMSFIQVFTRFLGDPIPAAALVIGAFLFFAGAGSMAQPHVTRRVPAGILVPALGIVLIVAVYSVVLSTVFEAAAGLSATGKTMVGTCLLAPLAFLLGMPFPWGLSMVHRKAVAAVPVAWAVNGFASVVSTSVAVLVTMTYGFKVLSIVAAAIYALAGTLS
ncbi:MAG: hypothetical protein RDU20_06145, partial [Desulfomonilaceae bacterium]|nr:hypothetical protein [Desulfomonilaceae bacterium]